METPTTTPEELEELRDLSREIAAVESNPYEPRCVAAAFRYPGEGEIVLTMQGWIELSRICSPLIEEKPLESIDEVEAASAVFGLVVEDLEADELAAIATAMLDEVRGAFGMALVMSPGQGGEKVEADSSFGSFLPVWTILVSECGLSVAEADALPVRRAFALVACLRRNQGWHAKGAGYRLRDLGKPEESENTEPQN